MKKLKFGLSNLPGAEVLTKDQLKKVVGGLLSGGTCRYHFNDSGITMYGDCESKGAAIIDANHMAEIWGQASYCCDSCESLGFPPCPTT
jgi:hypothetical protein